MFIHQILSLSIYFHQEETVVVMIHFLVIKRKRSDSRSDVISWKTSLSHRFTVNFEFKHKKSYFRENYIENNFVPIVIYFRVGQIASIRKSSGWIVLHVLGMSSQRNLNCFLVSLNNILTKNRSSYNVKSINFELVFSH